MQMLLSCRLNSMKTTIPSKGTQKSFGIFSSSDSMRSSMQIMRTLRRLRRCWSRISRRTPLPLALEATLIGKVYHSHPLEQPIYILGCLERVSPRFLWLEESRKCY